MRQKNTLNECIFCFHNCLRLEQGSMKPNEFDTEAQSGTIGWIEPTAIFFLMIFIVNWLDCL